MSSVAPPLPLSLDRGYDIELTNQKRIRGFLCANDPELHVLYILSKLTAPVKGTQPSTAVVKVAQSIEQGEDGDAKVEQPIIEAAVKDSWVVNVIPATSLREIREAPDLGYTLDQTIVSKYFGLPREASLPDHLTLDEKRTLVLEFLTKGHLPCEVMDGSIRVFGCVYIDPPFGLGNIRCDNEVILLRVRSILSQAPMYKRL